MNIFIEFIMNKLVFGYFLFLLICYNVNAQTYYYKQIGIKEHNGKVSNGDEDSGQFITFTKKGCYDSDREGYTVNNGNLTLFNTNAKFTTYYGESFWGMVKYRVSTDKSRINIVLDDIDRIYIYERSTPPNGIMTCSLIKKSTSTKNIDIIPTPINTLNLEGVEKEKPNVSMLQSHYNSMEEKLRGYFNTYERYLSSSSDSQSAAMGVATSIINLQRQMKDWRDYASRQGVTLSQSAWEIQQPSPYTIHIEKKKNY